MDEEKNDVEDDKGHDNEQGINDDQAHDDKEVAKES